MKLGDVDSKILLRKQAPHKHIHTVLLTHFSIYFHTLTGPRESYCSITPNVQTQASNESRLWTIMVMNTLLRPHHENSCMNFIAWRTRHISHAIPYGTLYSTQYGTFTYLIIFIHTDF